MASSTYALSLVRLTKRLKVRMLDATVRRAPLTLRQRASPPTDALKPTTPHIHRRHETTSTSPQPRPHPPLDAPTAAAELARIRLPRAVQAAYLDPLRHPPPHSATTADLQLRSYSLRNLEVFADFAMRAAYYLGLSASGPSPLPRITERWTVPRSSFVHKKSQENFERVTVRRRIEIRGGHPEVVGAWLAFLRKRQYYGLGMKAHVFEFGGVGVAGDLDGEAERIREGLGETLELVGGKRGVMGREEEVGGRVEGEVFKMRWGAGGAMGGAQSVPHAGERIETVVVR
ncbi:hypothetical protein LTR08_005981 [Meristemomyces frigidus]|nr:hypothetical protein LTR08_005981 [Meristemomyces frigidus]